MLPGAAPAAPAGSSLVVRALRWLAIPALVLALASPARAADAVEYYATVDRERIALDETVTLQVTLAFDQDQPAGEVALPDTPEFDVVTQGRSEQMSFSFGSGGSSFRKVRTYTLVLRPRREGTLAILPGRVEIGGKRYETGKISVEVGPAGSGTQNYAQRGQGAPRIPGMPPMPGFDDPFGDLLGGGPQPKESDLFLRATIDKKDVYVGEQVTLSVWLLSRVDVSHVEGLKMPRLDGFWAEELETPRQITAQTKYVDGVPYRAYLIQRRALFPLRAGEVAVDPVELDIVTGRSFFGGGRRQHRASPGAKIAVKELPAGAPAAFRRGNVGQWELSVQATPGEVALGNPVTVRIAATGQGNLQNLELPQLGKLEGFKIFEPTRTQDEQIRDLRYGGSKTLEYVLVPERAGTFEVPPLTFAWFDPAAGAYQTQRTPAIPLTVQQGAGGAVAAQPPAAPPAEKTDEGGLQPLRTAPVVVGPQAPLYERPWFVAALAAPLLAVAAAAAPLLRRQRAGEKKPRRKAAGGAGLPAEVRALADRGDAAFFAACERALLERATALLGRPAHGLRRSDLAAALREAGVGAEAVAALDEALQHCEAARYAPAGTADLAAARAAAEAALRGVEEAA